MKLRSALAAAILAASSATANEDPVWEWMRPTGEIADIPETDETVCVRHILKAQEKYGIPNDLLLAIGLQETGTKKGSNGKLTVWPWSANANGTGKWFPTKTEALQWASDQWNSGTRSIDLGCMQINQRWHPEAFSSFSEAFSPQLNVDYAARLLVRLKTSTGSWETAAGSYHSFTPELRKKYYSSLAKKISYIARNRAHFYDHSTSFSQNRHEFEPQRTAPRPMWSAEISKGKNTGFTTLFSKGQIRSPIMGH